MIRVLIVDDEPLVLEMMRRTIHWAQFGMTVVGSAGDGRSAIEFLKKNSVDVVFTDMKMPHMGGLELVRHIHEFLPEIVFVAISSYDDYNLVRQSFRSGVFDYMLKIDIDDPEVMTPLLERLKLQIMSVKKVLKGDFSPERILAKIGLPEQQLRRLSYQMLSVYTPNDSRAVWVSELLFLLKSNTADFIFGFHNWQIVILCYQPDNLKLEDTVAFLKRQLLEQIEGADQGQQAFIGISEAGTFDGLPELYPQTQQALRGRFYHPKQIVHLYRRGSEQSYRRKAAALAAAVQRERIASIPLALFFSQLDALLEEAAAVLLEPQYLWNDLDGLFGLIQQTLQEDFPSQSSKEPIAFRERIEAAENGPILLEECHRLVNELILQVNQRVSLHLWDVIQAYFETQYSDPALSLKNMADDLKVSKHVVSSCIIENSGLHFRPYLNKIRLNHAKCLLENTELRVSEIAERTGYVSTEHFSRLFSAQFGKPPSTYASLWRK